MSNPREKRNVGKMVCWHRRYRLGDKHSYPEPYDFWIDLAKKCGAKPEGDETFKELGEIVSEKYTVHPLYLYDHSGITISMSPFSCPWDSGQVGYIYAKRRKTKTEEEMLEIFSKEVAKYDDYLREEE